MRNQRKQSNTEAEIDANGLKDKRRNGKKRGSWVGMYIHEYGHAGKARTL